MKEEDRKEVKEIIDNSLAEAFSKKAVPVGYTKCSNCSKLIPTDIEKCPYCTEPEPEPEKEKDDLFEED